MMFSKGCVTTAFLDIPDICPLHTILDLPLHSPAAQQSMHLWGPWLCPTSTVHVVHLAESLLQSHEAHLVGTTCPAVLISHPPFSRDFLLQERGHLILPKYLQGGSLPHLDPRYASFAASGNIVTGSGE